MRLGLHETQRNDMIPWERLRRDAGTHRKQLALLWHWSSGVSIKFCEENSCLNRKSCYGCTWRSESLPGIPSGDTLNCHSREITSLPLEPLLRSHIHGRQSAVKGSKPSLRGTTLRPYSSPEVSLYAKTLQEPNSLTLAKSPSDEALRSRSLSARQEDQDKVVLVPVTTSSLAVVFIRGGPKSCRNPAKRTRSYMA